MILWVTGIISARIASSVVFHLRRDLSNKLMRLPISYIDRTPHGDIISRFVNDADTVFEGLFQFTYQLFSAIVIIIAALVFMMLLSPALTLAVVLVTPFIFLVSTLITKKSNQTFQQNQKQLGELYGFVEEQIEGQKLVAAFSGEKSVQRRFEEINDRLYASGQKSQFLSSLTNPSTRLLKHFSYVTVGLVGGMLAIKSGLSIGVIASFLTYSEMFIKPFNEFTAIMTQILSASACARRCFAFLEESEQPPDNQNSLPPVMGHVELCNVTFAYMPEKPLIKNLSLTVKAGSKVAVVGPTGAGKTTLINLLMRFYDVISGSILIDGTDILSVSRQSLRSQFAMVLQESWLFGGTIKENIAYGAQGATNEMIITAAKSAYAHSFIKMLPDGYDTIIEPGAANLSTGQKQLLTIARAMLCNPPVLILDEATSSVDSLTEQKIQKGFAKMMRGRTSFVIAHRLSTIKNADLILVMDKGDVVEQGTHTSLLKQGGLYRRLHDSQFAGEESA